MIDKLYLIYKTSNIINGLNNTTDEFKKLRNDLNKHSSNLFNKRKLNIYDIYTEIDEILINPMYINNEELFKHEMEKRLILLKNMNDLFFFTNEKKKKQTIPAIIKKLVWNTYIGEDIGKTKCMCCKKIDITQLNFICGHIISEYNGGKVNVENMRPICNSCNLSMGTKNMHEFILNYFYE